MNIKTQKFLVLGISKSGYAAADYLLKNGADTYLFEELNTPKIAAALEKLTAIGGKIISKEQAFSLMRDIDVVVISPGIPINYDLAVEAKNQGKRLIGELEFGFTQFNPLTIAVTGTNGKTTTVSLINEVFATCGRKSVLVGNVGVPVSGEIDAVDKSTVVVTEVSSFQLESIKALCPHIACILNIAPDHLERHYNMENYVFLKKRLLKNLTESEYAVLNYDDEVVRGFADDTKAKKVWVSTVQEVDGAYVKDGKLYYKGEYIVDKGELALKEEHNVQNTLFAIAACKLCGVKNEDVALALKTFKGVRHRMEFVAEKGGVKYVNDAKATNTASTISALSSLTMPTVLILGGSEKGETYDALFQKVKESPIKQVILTGASRYRMLESAGRVGVHDITVTGDFTGAIKIAALFAETGDCVLLSPACASFDRFSDFEERGETFKQIVEGL